MLKMTIHATNFFTKIFAISTYLVTCIYILLDWFQILLHTKENVNEIS